MSQAMCSHMKVIRRNNDIGGLVTKEWWECCDCGVEFTRWLPTPTAIPAQEARIPVCEYCGRVGGVYHEQQCNAPIGYTPEAPPEPIQPRITPTCFSKREREILGLTSNIMEPIQPSVEFELTTSNGDKWVPKAQCDAALARAEKAETDVEAAHMAVGIVLNLHGCGGDNCTQAQYLKDAEEMMAELTTLRQQLKAEQDQAVREIMKAEQSGFNRGVEAAAGHFKKMGWEISPLDLRALKEPKQ